MLKGKKILLGVSGSIAAYKTAFLVRLLVREGAEVRVIMTPSATEFITPLTLSTLSGHIVLHKLATDETWANHVQLGRWADIMLIAPLSCNTLSKMSSGLCDNLLMAVYLSATCPVAVAPAMDEDMWHHPSTRDNISRLEQFGNHILPVETGPLASGLTGEGRMAEPDRIVSWLSDFFLTANHYKGKKILVTAGPTYEQIDPVRYIGNHSSGKMGIAVATACRNRGADVTLVLGPTAQSAPGGMRVIQVTSASEMHDAAVSVFPGCDIAIMTAAVADYTVTQPAAQKIKKKEGTLELILEPTRDILKTLGDMKKPDQLLVGFALETENEKENAIGKLKRKNADFIVMNSMRDLGAGFGADTNKISIFDKGGREWNFGPASKQKVAAEILNIITPS